MRDKTGREIKLGDIVFHGEDSRFVLVTGYTTKFIKGIMFYRYVAELVNENWTKRRFDPGSVVILNELWKDEKVNHVLTKECEKLKIVPDLSSEREFYRKPKDRDISEDLADI